MWAPDTVEEVRAGLADAGYLADAGLATALHLALRLERPLFLEGDAGVGKTEIAKVVAELRSCELIRLQCHEALDVAQALYEWDHARQLLHLRAAEATGADVDRHQLSDELHHERFLIRRPVLAALEPREGPAPVLLVDELDRADDTFEALLLEVLSDHSVTVPELGRIAADEPPVVVITSNRTRDVHDALKRRCLYHWVEHPDFDREVAIIGLRAPETTERIRRQVAAAAGHLRGLALAKPPGIAETIDWARAVTILGRDDLDADVVAATLGAVLKYREDQARVTEGGMASVVETALAAVGS